MIDIKVYIKYYLYFLLIIPILLRYIFGNLTYVTFHPGVLIHGFTLIILGVYFLRKLFKGVRSYYFVYITLIFSICYLFNLLVIEILLNPGTGFFESIEFTYKIYLLLLIAFIVYENAEYFKEYSSKILVVNSIVLLINVFIGYFFQIGFQSYSQIEDSYKGFLGGNDTSIFTFVAFAIGLYTLTQKNGKNHRTVSFLILFGSIFSMYIIGTKAYFVALIILFMFLFERRLYDHNLLLKKIINYSIFALVSTSTIIALTTFQDVFSRITQMYFRSIETSLKLSRIYDIPETLLFFNYIAPGRFVQGVLMLASLFSSSWVYILLGFGVVGIGESFGRVPMIHLFSVIGQYGLLGYLIFFVPQFFLAVKIILKRKFSMINVIYVSIFLYGTLGGFVYGVTHTSVLYGMVFGLSLWSIKNED